MSGECATTPTKSQLEAGLNLYVATYGSFTIQAVRPATPKEIKVAIKNLKM